MLHNNRDKTKTKDLLRLVDMLKVEWVVVWANQVWDNQVSNNNIKELVNQVWANQVSNNNTKELVNQDNKKHQTLDQDHSLQ